MKIAKETWVILFIGVVDLISTIMFIQNHGAEEANPIFRRYWEMGLLAFIFAKMALLLGPLVVLEWARKRNPRFVYWSLRGAIAAYLVLYGIGFIRMNTPVAHAEEVTALPPPPRIHYVFPEEIQVLMPLGYHEKAPAKQELKNRSAQEMSVTTF